MPLVDDTSSRHLRIERLAYAYSSAVEASEFAAAESILTQAESDPALSAAIIETGVGFAQDSGFWADSGELKAARERIRAVIAATHNASLVPDSPSALTIGQVATHVLLDRTVSNLLTSESRESLKQLRTRDDLLPDDLSGRSVRTILTSYGQFPDAALVAAFRKVSILASLRLGEPKAQLAAARSARSPRKRGDKK